MEMQITIEELRTRKIFLAVPMYGGMCHGQFAKSVADLTALCTQYGIPLRHYYLFNESLITRARNYCVDEFLRSDCTHLMFVDSDIGFDANDVLTLAALQSDESAFDVIGAVYPKKCISWEKIVDAVNKGVADKNPSVLDQFVGDFVFNPIIDGKATTIPLNEPVQVLEIGTGFMMIKKDVFRRYGEKYTNIFYKPDHVRAEHFDGSRKIGMFFQSEIDPESERYLSEDYLFCQNVRKMGGGVWICPWMNLQHAGTYVFGGSLSAMASIGANPTADPDRIKGMKKK